MQLHQKNDSDFNFNEEERAAFNCVQPGAYLYGYCGGRFGRDSYGDKLVLSKTYKSVTVLEDGVQDTSFEIHSWADLVKSSNNHLKHEINGEDY